MEAEENEKRRREEEKLAEENRLVVKRIYDSYFVLCRGASFLTFVISQTCQLKFPLCTLSNARS